MSTYPASALPKIAAAFAVACFCTAVRADRLILTPAPTTLFLGSTRAEAMQSLGQNPQSDVWASSGTQYAEVEVAGFHRQTRYAAALSVTTQILPESDYFPAIAIGMRDITDSTVHYRGLGYHGRSVFIVGGRTPTKFAASPYPIRNLSYSLGLGEGGLHGPFGSVSGDLLPKLRWVAEWDSRVFNEKLSYTLSTTWQLDAVRIGKSTLVGLEYNTPVTIF